MKIIISGRTFDTANSTHVAAVSGQYVGGARDDYPGATVRFNSVLYRTKKGRFFVHDRRTILTAEEEPMVDEGAHELAASEVIGWIDDMGAVISDATGLDLPDEA